MADRRQSKPRRKWTEQMNDDPLSCKREAVAMTQMEQPSLDCYGKKEVYQNHKRALEYERMWRSRTLKPERTRSSS